MDIFLIGLIIVVVAGIVFFYLYSKKAKNTTTVTMSSSFDVETLVKALGGIENIDDVSSSPSKLSVILKNQSIVDIASIQSLGASGIVEGKQTLSIIFGKQSSLIEKDIKSKL